MRKWVAFPLLFLGAFLFVTAVVAQFWAPNVAERTPLNVDTYTYLSGEADKLNPATGELDHVAVAYTSHTLVDPKKSDGDNVVFVNTKCVNIDENDPADCLPGTDERVITNSIDTFVTDRRTALATNDDLPDGAVAHEGLVNKWPFNAEKKTYPYWDGTLGRAVDAEYVGTETLDGLETYRYDISVPPTSAEIIEDTQGTYSTEQSIWVDPRTGSIIDQSGGQVLATEAGDTLLDINVSYTDETVAANVDDAKANGKSLTLLLTIVPIVGALVGLLLLAIGVVLLLASRRRAAHTE